MGGEGAGGAGDGDGGDQAGRHHRARHTEAAGGPATRRSGRPHLGRQGVRPQVRFFLTVLTV